MGNTWDLHRNHFGFKGGFGYASRVQHKRFVWVIIRLSSHRNKRNVVPLKRQHKIETGLLIYGPDFAVISGVWGN